MVRDSSSDSLDSTIAENYTIEDLEELLDKIPYEIFIKDTLSIIKSVVTPTGTVVDNEAHIKEWIKNPENLIMTK